MTKIFSPKKLIEVALPLDDINAAAAREKSIRHGHPSTLHLWWARRPLAAARAVIFAQMVNDPGYQDGDGFKYGVNKKEAEIKREKLFQIIRDLVKWENTNNEVVLNRARDAIKESWRETCHLNRYHPQAAELFNPEKLPAFHDPFAGGGAIPLEAQRLGLKSHASDLNPVAVMINKAMIEIPPKFAGQAPVGPIPESEKQHPLLEEWSGAKGLAEDVRRYGHWMREEAFKRVGHLYPKVKITDEIVAERPDLKPYAGEELTVIAWLWARTVKSPNPAFSHVDVPLVKSFILSSKKGQETWLKPVIEGDKFSFKVKSGVLEKGIKEGTRVGNKGNFKCLISDTPISNKYVREHGASQGFNNILLSVVCDTGKRRVFIDPEFVPNFDVDVSAHWRPEQEMPSNPRYISPPLYGLKKYSDIFTERQLITLATYSDLVLEARKKIVSDLKETTKDINPEAYSDAITTYLGLAVSRLTDICNSLCMWENSKTQVRHVFTRQAIPMLWDYAEPNVFSNSAGDLKVTIKSMTRFLERINTTNTGNVSQENASNQETSNLKVISTDPPYYDNIGYADLSDFFYVWLRKTLRDVHPDIFGTLVSPKNEELVANPYRQGGKAKAELFFLEGMTQALSNIATLSHPVFPVSIYYAFKQSETKAGSTTSAGWETFLEAVIRAGFSIDGTWPMRTELSNRMVGSGTNALASSVILVCKKREIEADFISRREFQRELREQMPDSLEAMIGGSEGASPIAPVDLAQAAIGPGIGIFSKYDGILEADGSKMSVHEALILINRAITDHLNPDSGRFDNDTLFCDDWFNQYGWSTGLFGEANTLAQAKGTSVTGVKEAGVVESGGGKVRLLKWSEYPTDWDPKTDHRTPVWEACHQMIRVLNQQGESEAGALLARMPERGETIRQLAYHLYTLCERKKWAEDARAYNELIGSWHAIVAASHQVGERHYGQTQELEF
ncbi:DUF1156 domain-containing protein [Oceanospirillaceae bacterium]|nr:DUF1156 domain-containing protein [Oceanospirillaceae bacterium]